MKDCCDESGGGTRRRRRGRSRRHAPDGVLTLGGVDRGKRVRVRRVHGGRRLVHRLAALGLVPGSQVTVQRSSGPAIVELGGARLVVGHRAASAIEVEEAE